MIISIFLVALGFLFLLKGADFLVEGASSLAKRLGVTDLMIGLTVVAFGTSMPELVVNIFSAIQGSTDIALGNVIGSNIFNTLLILGLAAILMPLAVKHSTVWREIPLCIFATLLILINVNDNLLRSVNGNIISRTEGIILLLVFGIFLYYVYEMAKQGRGEEEEDGFKKMKPWRSLSFILIGMAGLFLGGRWVVNGALDIANVLGVSEFLISVVVVALGTSLPELVTTIVAAYKKNMDVAVGNIIGSNIFNIFLVLGATSVIKDIPFEKYMNFDVIYLLMASILLFGFMFIGEKHKMQKWQGITFIGMFVFYILFVLVRG
ncbi:calcium/sodium antiporter [Nanoarchaeota archaeon]